jgi:hypothetical protein
MESDLADFSSSFYRFSSFFLFSTRGHRLLTTSRIHTKNGDVIIGSRHHRAQGCHTVQRGDGGAVICNAP